MVHDEEMNAMETAVWPYLTCIKLTKNKIKALPLFLFRCDKLEELFVSNNKLSKMPADLSKLKNL